MRYARTYYSPSIHQPISILFVRVYTAQCTRYICLTVHITLYFSPYITCTLYTLTLCFSFIYTHLPQYDQALYSIIIETPSSSSLSLTNVYQFICRYHLSYNYEYFQQKYLEVLGKVVNEMLVTLVSQCNVIDHCIRLKCFTSGFSKVLRECCLVL